VLISEKIMIFVMGWIMLALFVTSDSDLDKFIILILIGFIVIKEFTDRLTTTHIKKRLNIFIYGFLIVFIAIIGERIINMLDI